MRELIMNIEEDLSEIFNLIEGRDCDCTSAMISSELNQVKY